MNIFKISIKEVEIPIQKGTLRLVDFGNETTIEVELNVHPTVVNFINTLGYIQEKVTILSKHNDEINGDFDIHTGKSSLYQKTHSKKQKNYFSLRNPNVFEKVNIMIPIMVLRSFSTFSLKIVYLLG